MDWKSMGINLEVHTFGSIPEKQFIDGEIANVKQALNHTILQEVKSTKNNSYCLEIRMKQIHIFCITDNFIMNL